MLRKLALSFTVAALAVASAATYRVTLFQPSVVQGQELKAGQYRLELKENKVLIESGRSTVQADVKVETADQKFDTTVVRYGKAGDKLTVQEIRLGGTRTRLVFNE